jgi:uncharacterized protein YhaN
MTQIRQIRVDGFGPHYDTKLVLPTDGVVVVYGPNETGKTSLHEFVGQMLFGSLKNPGINARYKPVRGGRQGGEVVIALNGQELEIIRRFEEPIAKRLQVRGDGIDLTAADAETWLANAFRPVDRSVFRRVFSITLDPSLYDEMQPFDDDETTVLDRLAISATFGGTADVSQRLNALASSLDALYAPRARKNRLNDLLAQYDDQKRVLREAVREASASTQLVGDLNRLRDEATVLQQQQRRIDQQLASADAQRQLRELQVQIDILESQREPDVQLADRAQIEAWRSSLEQYREIESRLRDAIEAHELASHASPISEPLSDECVATITHLVPQISSIRDAVTQEQQLLDNLQESEADSTVPLADVSDVDAAQLQTQAERFLRELDQLDARRHVQMTIPAAPIVNQTKLTAIAWVGLGCLVPGAGIAVASDSLPLRVVGLAVLLVGVLLVMNGRTTADTNSDHSPRHDSSDDDVQERLEREIESFLGSYLEPEYRQPQLDHAAQLQGLRAMLADSRAYRESAKTADAQRRQVQAIAQRLVEVDQALDRVRLQVTQLSADRLSGLAQLPQILELHQRTAESQRAALQYQAQLAIQIQQLQQRQAEAALGIEFLLEQAPQHAQRQAFLARIDHQREIDQQLQQLLVRRDALSADVSTEALGSVVSNSDAIDVDPAQLQRERDAVQDQINQIHAQIGALTEQHRHLMSSTAIADAELQRQALATEMLDVFGQLLAGRLAQHVIHQQLGIHERQHQPAVFRRTSEWFAHVSNGRYTQVLVRDGHVIVVDSNGNEITNLAALSRGTIEQLYVLLRFALADEIGSQGAGIPFVLDEILINFDDQRRQQFYPVLADIATRHQVLYFTCHQWMRDELSQHTNAAVLTL